MSLPDRPRREQRGREQARKFALAAAVLVAGALIIAGCRSRPQAVPPPAPAPGAAPAPGVGVQPDEFQQLHEQLQEMERRLAEMTPAQVPAREAQQQEEVGGPDLGEEEAYLSHEMEVNRRVAAQLLDAAERAYRNFNFREARRHLEKLEQLALDPSRDMALLDRARQLRREVKYLLGISDERVELLKQFWEGEMKVRLQEVKAEIENHFQRGLNLFEQEAYEDAIKQFERALEKIRWNPYEIEVGEIVRRAPELIERARELAEVQQLEEQRLQRGAAEQIARIQEEQEQKEKRARIKKMFRQAVDFFELRSFDRAEGIAMEMLKEDPGNLLARELREDASRMKHKKEYDEILRWRVEYWKEMMEYLLESIIPFSEDRPVRFPPGPEWELIANRRPAALLEAVAAEEEVPEEIIRALDQEMDLEFTDAPLSDIVTFVRNQLGINIDFDREVREEGLPDRKVSFNVTGLRLKRVLKLLLQQYGLDYIIEEGMVLITTARRAEGEPRLEIHDVRDLLARIENFPGPNIVLQADEEDMGGLGTGFELEEEEAPITAEDLEELIRQNVSPETWDEYEGVSVSLTPHGQLLVVHTPEVQEQVREFLQNLRSFTGSMVAIEARFLTCHDNFLEDMGFDWRGINDVDKAIEWQPGLYHSDADADGNLDVPGEYYGPFRVESGFFHGHRNEGNHPRTYDLRFHSGHLFTDAAGAPAFELGRSLDPSGGLGLVYQLLGWSDFQVVMHALRKDERATEVTAPRITVFNTQRAHIMVANQRAYIRDYDVEVATGITAFDPIIGIIQDGLVLDVRPIISNDRKFITLEIRPTVAILRELREVDIRNRVPIQTPIQLPLIEMQRAQATVRMPDRGTIIVAGLKNILDRDMRSETPLLARIPIIGALFQRKAKSYENRNLILIIHAELIEMDEREREET